MIANMFDISFKQVSTLFVNHRKRSRCICKKKSIDKNNQSQVALISDNKLVFLCDLKNATMRELNEKKALNS